MLLLGLGPLVGLGLVTDAMLHGGLAEQERAHQIAVLRQVSADVREGLDEAAESSLRIGRVLTDPRLGTSEDGRIEFLRETFARSTVVREAGPDVTVLARLDDGTIVAVRQGRLLGTSFHPELTGDSRLHALFVGMVEEARRATQKTKKPGIRTAPR